jgi:hypothetical protein
MLGVNGAVHDVLLIFIDSKLISLDVNLDRYSTQGKRLWRTEYRFNCPHPPFLVFHRTSTIPKPLPMHPELMRRLTGPMYNTSNHESGNSMHKKHEWRILLMPHPALGSS